MHMCLYTVLFIFHYCGKETSIMRSISNSCEEHGLALWDFSGGSVVNNPPANAKDAGDAGSTPGSGRAPGEGNGNPLQYSCLGNLMDRGA